MARAEISRYAGIIGRFPALERFVTRVKERVEYFRGHSINLLRPKVTEQNEVIENKIDTVKSPVEMSLVQLSRQFDVQNPAESLDHMKKVGELLEPAHGKPGLETNETVQLILTLEYLEKNWEQAGYSTSNPDLYIRFLRQKFDFVRSALANESSLVSLNGLFLNSLRRWEKEMRTGIDARGEFFTIFYNGKDHRIYTSTIDRMLEKMQAGERLKLGRFGFTPRKKFNDAYFHYLTNVRSSMNRAKVTGLIFSTPIPPDIRNLRKVNESERDAFIRQLLYRRAALMPDQSFNYQAIIELLMRNYTTQSESNNAINNNFLAREQVIYPNIYERNINKLMRRLAIIEAQ